MMEEGLPSPGVPHWADADVSRDMPFLRARGESQYLEYKRELPETLRDFAKEVAAFASTNDGMILLGVDNDGGLVGLEGCDDALGRDRFLGRLEGVFRMIRPLTKMQPKFAIENGRTVLAISVPRGPAPIYFANHIAYVRQVTQSRPAEPEEIYERIVEHYLKSRATDESATADGADAAASLFHSRLGTLLVDVLIVASEFSDRQTNPWIDRWRSAFADVARSLREMAQSDYAVAEGVCDSLLELAAVLDDVAHMRLHTGVGQAFRHATEKAAELARQIFDARIASLPVSDGSKEDVRSALRRSSRQLRSLSGRAARILDRGGTQELQSEASKIGGTLLRCSYYDVGLGSDAQQVLHDIGRILHISETLRLQMDGGRSQQVLVQRIAECADRFDAFLEHAMGRD